MPVLAGIDYSLTSPAICVYDTEKGDFSYIFVSYRFNRTQRCVFRHKLNNYGP